MKTIKKYCVITIILIMSLFCSNLLVSEVFISNSPVIRSNLGEYIAMKFKTRSFDLASLNPFQSKNPRQLSDNEAQKRANEIESRLANIPLQTIARGVQAKSDGSTTIKVINTNDVEQVNYEFNLRDGRKIKISIMKELIDKYGWTEDDIKKMTTD